MITNNIKFTFGQNVRKPDAIQVVPFESIVELIKSDTQIKQNVERIRITANPEEKNKIKSSLPWFSVCQFRDKRNNESFDSTTHFLFDFDHLENLSEVKSKLKDWDYAFAVFVSPSGDGLKLIVRLDREITNVKGYYDYYVRVSGYLEKELGIKLDNSTKDPSRACFISHDPDIYVNHNSREIELGQSIELSDEGDYYDHYNYSDYENVDMVESHLPSQTVSTPPKSTKREEMLKAFRGVPEGQRHSTMLKLVGFYSKRGMDRDFIYENTRLWNERNTPPFNEQEFEREFNSIYGSYVIEGNIEPEKPFWTDENGRIRINYELLIAFLQKNNFFKVEISKNTFEYVRLKGPFIKKASIIEMREVIYNHIKNAEIDNTNDVLNVFIKLSKDFFTSSVLNYLETINPFILSDNKDECYLFFKNCYVRITKDFINEFEYSKMGHLYVWEDSVINHEYSIPGGLQRFSLCISKIRFDDDPSIPEYDFNDGKCVCQSDSCLSLHWVEYPLYKSEFDQFLWNIVKEDTEWYLALVCSIGSLIHRYKNPADSKTVVFCDEEIPVANDANGGTGKSLVCKALEYVRKVKTIDGKNYQTKSRFKFQDIDYDTEVVVFDDVRKDFDFESLLSAITSHLVVEKKHLSSFTIPFDKSPKFVVTTNYTVNGSGKSFDRRKHEVEFSNYYNKTNKTPYNEFGHLLFDDWDKDEWSNFFSSIILYILSYLRYGFIGYEVKNLALRKMIYSTSQEFLDFADDNFILNVKHNKREMYTKFKETYPEYSKITSNKFTSWLKIYVDNMNLKMDESKSGRDRFFTLIAKNSVN